MIIWFEENIAFYSAPRVMDQNTRRIIGFAVQPIAIDGSALCRMFNQNIWGNHPPRRLSMDNDPLFQFKQWLANLRILEITAIHSCPFVPVSHPFVERLIGTVRREYLDHLFFWNSLDLQRKLDEFKNYFNRTRVHSGIDGKIPEQIATFEEYPIASLKNYDWKSHCNGLFHMPIAA